MKNTEFIRCGVILQLYKQKLLTIPSEPRLTGLEIFSSTISSAQFVKILLGLRLIRIDREFDFAIHKFVRDMVCYSF